MDSDLVSRMVYIPLKSFIAEHMKLVNILQKGNKKEMAKEAVSQKKELKDILQMYKK